MTEDVLFEPKGQVGIITLNRPAALNALTLPMIVAIQKQLEVWKLDPKIQAVIIQALPGKAFCAGGDVRWLYDTGRSNVSEAIQFFWHEYRLNYFIHHFGKPFISLMDGITMGGGVGIGLHGSHPIASPRFVFAMPETTIGFFPDIGASFLLARCPDQVGTYLGLTGERLGAGDALKVNLIKKIIPSDKMLEIIHILTRSDLSQSVYAQVDACLEGFALPEEDVSDSALNPLIATCFAHASVESIFADLVVFDNDWAKITLQNLKQKSPLSLKITLMQLIKARRLSFDQCLKMDFDLVNHFIQDHDFYEGVRALLVDKDRAPKWKPENLSLVKEDRLKQYFEPAYPELTL